MAKLKKSFLLRIDPQVYAWNDGHRMNCAASAHQYILREALLKTGRLLVKKNN